VLLHTLDGLARAAYAVDLYSGDLLEDWDEDWDGDDTGAGFEVALDDSSPMSDAEIKRIEKDLAKRMAQQMELEGIDPSQAEELQGWAGDSPRPKRRQDHAARKRSRRGR
jgi:hypothetical protein